MEALQSGSRGTRRLLVVRLRPSPGRQAMVETDDYLLGAVMAGNIMAE